MEDIKQTKKVEETTAKAEAKPASKDSDSKDVKNEVKASGKKTSGKKPSKRPLKKSSISANDGLIERTVLIRRISKTTKGGRKIRFSVLRVLGDQKGRVGFGMGKAAEIPNAIKKADKNARNNLTKVVINKKGTIYHEIVGKACAAKVLLKPAPSGTGIVAGGAIRAVIELAGYKDLYTKNLGKNTAANMIQATINGLKKQLSPTSIANMRDKNISNL